MPSNVLLQLDAVRATHASPTGEARALVDRDAMTAAPAVADRTQPMHHWLLCGDPQAGDAVKIS